MARKQQNIIIIALAAVLLIVGLIWLMSAREPAAPSIATTTKPPSAATAPVPTVAPAPVAGEHVAGKPASQKPAAPAPKQPLAPLLPGSSLTDQRFAAMSAKIVVAALGLKQDQDWEVNVLAYMSKVLDAEKVSETEYRQYAEALNKYPDRARAVAENIIVKAEKKLGYRVSMDNLPMFKVDKQKVEQIDKKLQKKLQ
ncbi:MAG: hypothetical protein ACYC63_03640 [Armatimonadota bacterium]